MRGHGRTLSRSRRVVSLAVGDYQGKWGSLLDKHLAFLSFCTLSSNLLSLLALDDCSQKAEDKEVHRSELCISRSRGKRKECQASRARKVK